MPRVSIFQKKRQEARNIVILYLAKEGYKAREIAEIIKERYRDVLSVSRVNKIIQTMSEK
jgi:transposase-like protein